MKETVSELKNISLIAGQIMEAFSLRDQDKINKLPTNIPHIGVVKYLRESPSEWKMLLINPGTVPTEITPYHLSEYVVRKLLDMKVTQSMTVEQFLCRERGFEKRKAECEKGNQSWHDELVGRETVLFNLSDEVNRKVAWLTQLVADINNRTTGVISRNDKLFLTVLCLVGLFPYGYLFYNGAITLGKTILAIVIYLSVVVGITLYLLIRSNESLQVIRRCIEEYIKKD